MKLRIKKQNTLNCLRQSKVYLVIGISGVVFFTLMAIYALLRSQKIINGYTEADWMAAIIFLILDLPYIYMILLRLNWKIVIKKNEFVFQNIFRKRKVCNYESVEIIFGTNNKYYLNGRHIVTVSHLIEGWYELEKAVYKKI